MNSSLLTASPQNEPETLVARVNPASERQAKTDGGKHASKWAVLSIVAVGVLMATLDSSIVNISLPAIARAFGVPLGGAIEWVIIAYLVVVAGALLTIGRLAGMIGRKPIWAAGLALFTLGSAFCGGSPSPGLLIAARALQGFGGAFILAISPAMLISAFALHVRMGLLGPCLPRKPMGHCAAQQAIRSLCKNVGQNVTAPCACCMPPALAIAASVRCANSVKNRARHSSRDG
ncbi:MAG TPA: MFS transporter [Ktedonobacteraceae bacterium]|nr:MFS transporter [Ktedonobacteraceae bacterium]